MEKKQEKKTTSKKKSLVEKENKVKSTSNIKKSISKKKNEEQKKVEKELNQEEIKAYKILSYIGILWLIGLIVPEHENKELKFHVGQGIILSIAELILAFIINIINNTLIINLFRQEVYYGTNPTGLYMPTFVGTTISSLLNLSLVIISIYYMAIGISNVLDNKQKELPIIGKYSFYK